GSTQGQRLSVLLLLDSAGGDAMPALHLAAGTVAGGLSSRGRFSNFVKACSSTRKSARQEMHHRRGDAHGQENCRVSDLRLRRNLIVAGRISSKVPERDFAWRIRPGRRLASARDVA